MGHKGVHLSGGGGAVTVSELIGEGSDLFRQPLALHT